MGIFKRLILILLIQILLVIVYKQFITVEFSYTGFFWDFNSEKLIESIFMITFLFFAIEYRKKTVSYTILMILLILMLVPFFTLFSLKNETRLYTYMAFISFFFTVLITKLPLIRLFQFKVHVNKIFTALFLCTGFIMLSLLFLNGFPTLKALNLFNVYEVRGSVKYGHKIMEYLVSWQAKVFNLFFIGYAIYTKRKSLFTVGIVSQIIIFLFTGHKSYLFAPILLIFIFFALQRKKLIMYLNYGLITILVLTLILYLNFGDISLGTILVRRVLFIPAQNYYYYYDYFHAHGFSFLSHSIFGLFLENKYPIPIPNLIGDYYYNNSSMWVNTGYLADAYMNFGFLGMILFSILLGLILLFLDSLSLKLDALVIYSVTLINLYNLVNGALLTTLLTGGLGVGILLLLFMANRKVQ